jgi:endonuclease III
MRRGRNIRSKELGIDIHSLRERELFRWFLACLLFGKPIQQDIARLAFLQLDEAGLNSPAAILDAGWKRLVDLLDRAHYVRYDFSTATKLLDICRALMMRYGSLERLIAQYATPAELGKALQEFKGIGPVTARIFLREVRPLWDELKSEARTEQSKQRDSRQPRQISRVRSN